MDILGLGALRALEPQDWFPLLFSDLGPLAFDRSTSLGKRREGSSMGGEEMGELP
jgi:hypothetical protein